MKTAGTVIGILVVGAACLQAQALPEVLTWQDCVQIAAARNPDLRSATLSMEARRADYRGSYNGLFPQLSLSNSYTTSSSISKLWQAEGVASLDLINANVWASIQSASASLRESEANRQATSSNVLLSLYKAFAALLYSQQQISVATHIRELWHTNAQMVNLRYQSGRESKGNNMRTQAETLQADLSLTQAARDLRVAQQQLSQALGQDDFTALAATGTWAVSDPSAVAPDFGRLLETLPSIRAQKAVTEQAKAAVRAAQSSLWPTLGLRYGKGFTGTTEFPKQPSWSFTGTVNLPLFGNGPTATYYASAAAERSYEKALSDLTSLKHQARTTLESAWSKFAQARDQVRIQRAFLDAALQRKGESDIRYQNGLMSFQDWQVIMNDYVNSERGFLSAEQNVLLAQAQWHYASGQQLGE